MELMLMIILIDNNIMTWLKTKITLFQMIPRWKFNYGESQQQQQQQQ